MEIKRTYKGENRGYIMQNNMVPGVGGIAADEKLGTGDNYEKG